MRQPARARTGPGRDTASARCDRSRRGSSSRRYASRLSLARPLMATGVPGARRVDLEAAMVGGQSAADEARARASRSADAPLLATTRPMEAGGSTCSCVVAATRSRRAPRRSCGTSSPNASSACRGHDRRVDFAFTPEQDELRAQARSFLAGRAEPSWLELAELGWTGVSLAAELGGAGLGFLEEAVLFEETGRALTARPVLVDDRPRPARSSPRPPGRSRGGEGKLDARAGAARPGPRHRRSRRNHRRSTDLGARRAPTARCCSTSDSPGRWAWSWAAKPAGGSARFGAPPELRSRSLAALSLEACGVGQRALESRSSMQGSASSSAGRSAPTRRSRTRSRRLRGARARPVPALWAAWCIALDDPRADIGRRSCQVLLRRGRSCGLRAFAPGARRPWLHMGTRAASALQAGARRSRHGRLRAPSCEARSPPISSTGRIRRSLR